MIWGGWQIPSPLSSEPPVEIKKTPPAPAKENTEPRWCRDFGTSNKRLCLCDKGFCELGADKYGKTSEAEVGEGTEEVK